MPQVDFTEDELLALAVIKPDPGDLKPEYEAAHTLARGKCATAYVEHTVAVAREQHQADEDHPTLNLAKRVAVDTAAIRSLVEDASTHGWTLLIDYTDAFGVKTVRRVIPGERGIFRQHVYGEEVVGTRDLDKGEPRTFRIDRIQRAELAE